MGVAVADEAMPVGTPVALVLAIRSLERRASGGSLLAWTPTHHHPVPSPATARRARCLPRRVAARGKLALDIALPTLCVACREPVDGEGVCAECWAKLSFIAPPFCPRLGIPFVYDPGPGLLSMEAIADPPAYAARPRRGAL